MSASVAPFLRWAGGKRWLAPKLAPLIRRVLKGRFVEPFLGSGAVFFAVEPEQALLGDLNEELIAVYRQVRIRSLEVEKALENLPVDRETYEKIRHQSGSKALDRAVRFIYLNRTCYGGLHRTNQKGKFNVPYGGGGRTPEPVYRDSLLVKAARLLRNPGIQLRICDFAELIAEAGEGDVVFCDPTYRSVGRGRFDRYGPIVFSWKDQERLAKLATEAESRGAVVIVMNADDPDIVGLYKDSMLFRVCKAKAIGNKSKHHSQNREIITVLDSLKRDIWSGLAAEAVPLTTRNSLTNGIAIWNSAEPSLTNAVIDMNEPLDT